EEIVETMRTMPYLYEIILVNDYPYDDTIDVLKKLSNEDSRIKVVQFARNFGQHAALMAGYQVATGDYIVSLDDDGQTPANEVKKLIDKLEEGYDVVYARYSHKKHSLFRNFGSKLNGWMTEVMLKKPKDLYVSSYFVMRSYIKEEILHYRNAYPYVIGLVLRSTTNITNVDVQHRQREQGRSGYTLGKLLGLWLNGFTAFSVVPLRLASFLGIFAAGAGFVYLIYVLVNKIVNPLAPIGWTSMIALVLIVGGIIMLILGMIGEYVGRIYISLNAYPQYVIKETINIKAGE
ncbi:MAG: glycosyltransferase family 2 protein, partial [Clostridium sp.]|nr:glycosyltransferase family 2 protein [Clostridium sp.]